jgi:hypothetical protein
LVHRFGLERDRLRAALAAARAIAPGQRTAVAEFLTRVASAAESESSDFSRRR